MSVNKPVISVIVPIYKIESVLTRCIDSILDQSFKDFELILIDDGSPDNCPAICDEYALKDKRIRVIHKKNEGLAETRNVGIKAARGDYIGFVDGDDFILPRMYEKLYDAVMENKVDLSICGFNRYSVKEGKESVSKVDFNIKSGVYDYDELVDILFSPNSALTAIAWNKLYKKDLFDGVHYPTGKIHEDEATAHVILSNAKKAAVIDEPLYMYSVNESGIILSPFSKKNFDSLFYCVERINFYKQKKEKKHLDMAKVGYWHIVNRLIGRSLGQDETIKEELKKMKKQFNKLYLTMLSGKAFGFKEKLVLTLYRVSPEIYTKVFFKKSNIN